MMKKQKQLKVLKSMGKKNYPRLYMWYDFQCPVCKVDCKISPSPAMIEGINEGVIHCIVCKSKMQVKIADEVNGSPVPNINGTMMMNYRIIDKQPKQAKVISMPPFFNPPITEA